MAEPKGKGLKVKPIKYLIYIDIYLIYLIIIVIGAGRVGAAGRMVA